MYRIVLLLLLACLLCGCTPEDQPSEPLPTAEETEETTEETQPPRDLVAEQLEIMTPEEKVGQLFLARCPAENAVQELQTYCLGGYILFDRDFEGQTPQSVRQTLAEYQRHAKIPMLIAVDEEGGTVCRVSGYSAFRYEPFPSPRQLYAMGGLELVLALETEKAMLLHDLGISVNMAPVCDITTEPSAFLYARSLGESPEETARFAAGAVERMAEFGVGGVLKHFPGYGCNVDTHTGIARDSRSLAELESCDLIPFRAGAAAGGAVLVSHNIVAAFDADLPATLSPAVHDYIRQEMGFEGVIVTDDLSMGAITDRFGAEEAAVLAVLAGNDLLCSTEYAAQYGAVLAAVQDGRILESTLDTAVTHVLTWKQQLGLLNE